MSRAEPPAAIGQACSQPPPHAEKPLGSKGRSGNAAGRGECNENPGDIGLLQLIAEDFATHERSVFEPGFWALAIHRFGNWRMGIRVRLVRAPLSLIYQMLYVGMRWCCGIELCYNVRLGRRIRIWHHGGMWIGAASIGDDVHLRHDTTLGIGSRADPLLKPVIGDRVDIGPGVCILGDVTVGDDCVIGANSVVIRDVPQGTTVLGVPARPVTMRRDNPPKQQRGDAVLRPVESASEVSN